MCSRCVLVHSGPQHLVMKGFLVGEDAKPWKGRDVVLWGTEVRTLCGDLFCVLIGHFSDCDLIYSELALLTIKYFYPSWTSCSELLFRPPSSTGTLQNSSRTTAV